MKCERCETSIDNKDWNIHYYDFELHGKNIYICRDCIREIVLYWLVEISKK